MESIVIVDLFFLHRSVLGASTSLLAIALLVETCCRVEDYGYYFKLWRGGLIILTGHQPRCTEALLDISTLNMFGVSSSRQFALQSIGVLTAYRLVVSMMLL